MRKNLILSFAIVLMISCYCFGLDFQTVTDLKQGGQINKIISNTATGVVNVKTANVGTLNADTIVGIISSTYIQADSIVAGYFEVDTFVEHTTYYETTIITADSMTVSGIISVTGTIDADNVNIDTLVISESLKINNNSVYGETIIYNSVAIDSCYYTDTFVGSDSWIISQTNYYIDGGWYKSDTGLFANVYQTNTDFYTIIMYDSNYNIFPVDVNVLANSIMLAIKEK